MTRQRFLTILMGLPLLRLIPKPTEVVYEQVKWPATFDPLTYQGEYRWVNIKPSETFSNGMRFVFKPGIGYVPHPVGDYEWKA